MFEKLVPRTASNSDGYRLALSPDQLFHWPITSRCCYLHRGSFIRKGYPASEPHILSMVDQSFVSLVQYIAKCGPLGILIPPRRGVKLHEDCSVLTGTIIIYYQSNHGKQSLKIYLSRRIRKPNSYHQTAGMNHVRPNRLQR